MLIHIGFFVKYKSRLACRRSRVASADDDDSNAAASDAAADTALLASE